MDTKEVTIGPAHLLVPADDIYFGNQDFVTKNYASELVIVEELMKKYGPERRRTLVDIGACMGITCIPAVCKGHFNSAIAIEPHPDNFALLEKNIARNHCEMSISVVNAAVYNHNALAVMRRTRKRHGTNSGAWSLRSETTVVDEEESTGLVVCMTLPEIMDEAKADDVDLVWADIQGREPLMLAGARGILHGVPFYMEVEPPLLDYFKARELYVAEVAARFEAFVDIDERKMPVQRASDFGKIFDRIKARKRKQTNVFCW